MTGLSVNKTSSCHSANAKLTMKISKTERCFDRGWANTQGVAVEVTKRRPNRVPTPQTPETTCRSVLPSHSHWLSLALTRPHSLSTLGLISRFSASHCGVFGRGIRLGFEFGSWWHFWNKYLCLRAEQHIRDFDSVASNT